MADDLQPVSVQVAPEVNEFNTEKEYWIGFKISMAPGWHIYSKDSYDMGLPTDIIWDLPEGLSVEKTIWPSPTVFESDGIETEGYDNQVFIAAQISTDDEILPGQYEIKGEVEWLACGESCVPGNHEFSISVPVNSDSTPQTNDAWSSLFINARNSLDAGFSIEETETTWLGAIALALIGGLILNLMPCVFPVLSLKILGFVNHAGDDPKKIKIHGLVFCAGVLLSFWALSGMLMGLRAAGELIGWGFQLQSPTFLVILTSLLVLLSLNFAGIFEIGTSLISTGSRMGRQFGYAGSFSSGILATILATPCTAPFMGTALGYALTQPPFYAFGIFTALAVGMMLPYLILSFSPSLLKFLPKPGAWMEKFKQAMAFPLLATVIWLLWVFGSQTNLDALCTLLLGLLLVSISAWIYGQFNTLTAKRFVKIGASLSSLIALTSGVYLGINAISDSEENPHSSEICTDNSYHSVPWMDYSEENLQSLLLQNKPVLIDFTASWCLTCQVTKKQIFGSKDVINTFKDKDIVILRADWTKRDPEITKALNRFGRSGVPTKVLFSSDPNKSPVVMPEVTNAKSFIQTLEAL